MEQQQYGAHVHTREEEREDETGRKIGVSKREKMRLRRAYDEWTETETENREHGGLLLVASGTSTRPHTLSLHRSAHSAGRQADGFDIRKRSGWLVLDDDDIRTHSHDSTVQSKRLA